jgi:hypothetical protein
MADPKAAPVQDRTARRVFAKTAPAKTGTVTLTIIGVRYFTPVHKAVVVAPGCTPFTVAAAGHGDTAPTDAQRARVLELWSSDPAVGDWCTFPANATPGPEHGQRKLTPSPTPTASADDKDDL